MSRGAPVGGSSWHMQGGSSMQDSSGRKGERHIPLAPPALRMPASRPRCTLPHSCCCCCCWALLVAGVRGKGECSCAARCDSLTLQTTHAPLPTACVCLPPPPPRLRTSQQGTRGTILTIHTCNYQPTALAPAACRHLRPTPLFFLSAPDNPRCVSRCLVVLWTARCCASKGRATAASTGAHPGTCWSNCRCAVLCCVAVRVGGRAVPVICLWGACVCTVSRVLQAAACARVSVAVG